jgi:hypothetical protein
MAKAMNVLPAVKVKSPLFRAHMAYIHDRQTYNAGEEYP